MGEIADMMLDGTLCCVCGVYLDNEDESESPQWCSGCEMDAEDEE